ncbi:MAG TPA: CDP-diacylglycerol--glycerol-3-phosphate 3-phosphatidyltransferase [Actinomycetaceae bacterium]|nr:CDP-diacylglycerol--glycerol-3-phosphate 3-phosphatidyltransferase [Actinomycetaceae bacterium]
MATDGQIAPTFNIANILTVIRLILVPVFVWLYLQESTAMRFVAAAVFSIAAITDQLDGHLARSRGLVTDFGKILDPIADKALVISGLLLLSWDGFVPWWVTILILVRELGITLLRMAMVRRAVMAASQGGKIKTTLQMIFLIGMLVPWHGFLPGAFADVLLLILEAVMYLALAVTLVTGVMYIRDAWVIAHRPETEEMQA